MQALSLLSLACTGALPREQHQRSLLRDHLFAQSSRPMSQSKSAAALPGPVRALEAEGQLVRTATARLLVAVLVVPVRVVVVPVRVVVVVLPGREGRPMLSSASAAPHRRLSWRQHQSSRTSDRSAEDVSFVGLHSSSDTGRTMSMASRGQPGLGRCLQQNCLRAGVMKLASLCKPWAQLSSTSLRLRQPMLLCSQHRCWRPARHPAQAPVPSLASASAEVTVAVVAAVVVVSAAPRQASAAVQLAHSGQCLTTSGCAAAQALTFSRPERWCCPAHLAQSPHVAVMPARSHSTRQPGDPLEAEPRWWWSTMVPVAVLVDAAVLASVLTATVVDEQPTPWCLQHQCALSPDHIFLAAVHLASNSLSLSMQACSGMSSSLLRSSTAGEVELDTAEVVICFVAVEVVAAVSLELVGLAATGLAVVVLARLAALELHGLVAVLVLRPAGGGPTAPSRSQVPGLAWQQLRRAPSGQESALLQNEQQPLCTLVASSAVEFRASGRCPEPAGQKSCRGAPAKTRSTPLPLCGPVTATSTRNSDVFLKRSVTAKSCSTRVKFPGS